MTAEDPKKRAPPKEDVPAPPRPPAPSRAERFAYRIDFVACSIRRLSPRGESRVAAAEAACVP